MIYGSVCSGIEAASAAWHPLGWRPAFFSEIEKFPSAVLEHHYPTVPNHGDMTKFKEWPDATLDVLVGGTPCQSFSVAGLRKGLDDPRGNLTLTYLAIAARYRPQWLVWENVPGVLSDATGAFGAFLGGLGQLGYGFAYRILDAQFFGVPQRRRRVFVVGHLGDWRRAAAVLFERHSLQGHPAPRRETRERIAPTISARTKGGGGLGTDFDCDGGLIPSTGDISHCLNAGGMGRQDYETETLVTTAFQVCFNDANGTRSDRPNGGAYIFEADKSGALTQAQGDLKIVTHALRGEGFDASEDGTGRGTPLVPVAHVDVMPTLRAGASSGGPGHGARSGDSKDELIVPVAFDLRGREDGSQFEGPHDTANIRAASGGSSRSYVAASAVRRLTPRECERLQGFPDDYTLIPFRNKPAADGPRYKALGNSMAVPVMAWIGQRIAQAEQIDLLTEAA